MMTNPFLAKLAAKYAVRNAPKIGKMILGIVAAILCTFCMLGTIIVNMVGSFCEQDDGSGVVIDEDYDISKTEIFKEIKAVYDGFLEEVKEGFEKREKEIIEENTYEVTIVVIDPQTGKKSKKKEKRCDVTVTIDISSVSMSYALAYINHSKDVMWGKKYKVNKKEIKKFYKDITTKEEIVQDKHYILRMSALSPEDVAARYYPEDSSKQEMYLQSFKLYEEFLGWQAGVNGGDTAYEGSITLEDIDDAAIQADIKAGKYTADDFGYMYATILGECASSNEGACAVGWCIMNRVDNGKFPSTVREVVTAPGQFAGYHPEHVSGPYTNTIVKNATAACLKRSAPNPIGDFCYFFGRVNGYDLWYEYTKGPKPIQVGGNVFHAGGGYVHNKQNKKTSDAVIIWSASEKRWY